MKITKIIRAVSLMALFSSMLINAYYRYKSMESYEKMTLCMSDLKNKLSDTRATASCLSRQLRAKNGEIEGKDIFHEKDDEL